jgi:glycosyltransferase involved in cell wall biosynthesis
MKVSVIIPTFNRFSLISRAIDSVLNQTIKPFEIIVVDDGSSDNTSTFIKNNYKSVKLIKQKNLGVSKARNVGIKNSSGDWIALLDSDDEWKKNKLEVQIKSLSEYDYYSVCHTNEIWVRNGIRVNQKKRHQKYGGDIFDKCLDICRISPSSIIFKKNIINDVGWFDEGLSICEDYDLWLRITANFKILFIDKPLVIKYGGHSDQLSKSVNGIEAYRIKSLENLLNNTKLIKDYKLLTIKMLITKLDIYKKGLLKRHKKNELLKINRKIKFWKNKLIEY